MSVSLKHNIALIRAEVKSELERGFRFADSRIGKGSGVSGTLWSPFIRLAYQYGARDQIRARGLGQLNLLLECASDCAGKCLEICGDGLPDSLDSQKKRTVHARHIKKAIKQTVDERFDDYLFYDETYMRSRQSHPRLINLKKALRDVFSSRLEVMVALALSKGDTYDDLVRCAFTSEEAQAVMGRDLDKTKHVLDMVEEERDLLDIPSIGRGEVIRMLHVSYSYARSRLVERLDHIYRDRTRQTEIDGFSKAVSGEKKINPALQ